MASLNILDPIFKMKLYTCSNCKSQIYFENNVCLNCGYTLGFDADTLSQVTLVTVGQSVYSDLQNKDQKFHFCKNAEFGTCNWIIPQSNASIFCKACNLNRIIPDLNNTGNLKLWKNIEVAKHRLVYSLLRLRLPVLKKNGDEETGIAFDFMADTSPKEKIMTGHDSGTITLNIDEADEASGIRQAGGADCAGRSADFRHGRDVPDVWNLCSRRPAL